MVKVQSTKVKLEKVNNKKIIISTKRKSKRNQKEILSSKYNNWNDPHAKGLTADVSKPKKITSELEYRQK